MTTIQIIWLCSVAAILIAIAIAAMRECHIHPMRFFHKHHLIGIEHYDFFFDDDDCDE